MKPIILKELSPSEKRTLLQQIEQVQRTPSVGGFLRLLPQVLDGWTLDDVRALPLSELSTVAEQIHRAVRQRQRRR